MRLRTVVEIESKSAQAESFSLDYATPLVIIPLVVLLISHVPRS